MAITKTIKEATWLKVLFSKDSEKHHTTIVYYNNQSAIFLKKGLIFHEKTKHINVRYYFVHDIIAYGDIIVSKVSIIDNPTNIMTNSSLVVKLKYCLNLVGIFAN